MLRRIKYQSSWFGFYRNGTIVHFHCAASMRRNVCSEYMTRIDTRSEGMARQTHVYGKTQTAAPKQREVRMPLPQIAVSSCEKRAIGTSLARK